MRARPPLKHQFEVYRDSANEWRWRLRAPNDKIVADSGEGYAKLPNVRTAIAALSRAFKRGFKPTLIIRHPRG
jgi:uncharacterized protein YegP (UPF0339 family)